jgi:formylglycine-generating enzyme required for sulfatase activity
MALVPDGPFVQGADHGPAEAAPAHGVVLDAFYIDINEVTHERFEKFREAMRENKRRIPPPARPAADRREPVTGIAWADAQAYAFWAKKDLPTEAEWEKAARGVDGFEYPWGEGPPVWPRLRVPGQIDQVGTFAADLGPFGLYDTAGNAREWCSDWYLAGAYERRLAEGGAALRNPIGPKSAVPGNLRVVKGSHAGWALWQRAGVPANERPEDVGFRCVVRMKRVRLKGGT